MSQADELPDYRADPNTLKWRTVPLIVQGEFHIGAKSMRSEMAVFNGAGQLIAIVSSVGIAELIVQRYNEGIEGTHEALGRAQLVQHIRVLQAKVEALTKADTGRLPAIKKRKQTYEVTGEGSGGHDNHARDTYRLVNGLTAISTGARDKSSGYRPMIANNGQKFVLSKRNVAYGENGVTRMKEFDVDSKLPPLAPPAPGQSARLKTTKRSPRGESK